VWPSVAAKCNFGLCWQVLTCILAGSGKSGSGEVVELSFHKGADCHRGVSGGLVGKRNLKNVKKDCWFRMVPIMPWK